MQGMDEPVMPSEVDDHVGVFDRFAARASHLVATAKFFTFALLVVVIWAPSILIIRDFNTWNFCINTVTTIGTWLLVALLENTTARSNNATQHKLNAIARALANSMDEDHADDAAELRSAIGLEQRESS